MGTFNIEALGPFVLLFYLSERGDSLVSANVSPSVGWSVSVCSVCLFRLTTGRHLFSGFSPPYWGEIFLGADIGHCTRRSAPPRLTGLSWKAPKSTQLDALTVIQ